MGYECKVLLDSINTAGDRLTTFQITYPRFVHCELMTHRVFSRNSSSSRAIPIEKMIEQVEVLEKEVVTLPAGINTGRIFQMRIELLYGRI